MQIVKWLFTWKGPVTRLQYFWAGTALVVVKYAIDSSVAASFGEPWRIWNYFLSSRDVSLFGLGVRQPSLYGMLWAVAIPFFWSGIALTLRRLQDAAKAPGWVFLFFVPVVNLGLFLSLTLLPTAPKTEEKAFPTSAAAGAVRIPRAAVGMMLAVVLGLELVCLSSRILVEYAWGLFLGVPFLTGFVSSWFLNIGTPHSRPKTMLVSATSSVLIGLGLIGLRYEGLLCVLMAFPLALPFALAGGLVARHILLSRSRPPAQPILAAWILILPLIMVTERAAKLEPAMASVTTSIPIDAPVSAVWRNVVAFPPLAAPTEWLFRAGIAYPKSAEIVGTGVGAVRYCRFSTGDFVEPITVWDENQLLAFDVSAQPQSMRELSPWKISPPHVELNYMRSRRGQFRLVAMTDHRTLLEGTTRYQNYFWPQQYWREWSDGIVHQIHLRVLRHIKQQAEAR